MGEYQALEIRARLLPEMLRLAEDKYGCHYCIPLDLLSITTEIIIFIICVPCSSAARQCTTYSNRLFFIPATSYLNKRPLVQRTVALLSSVIWCRGKQRAQFARLAQETWEGTSGSLQVLGAVLSCRPSLTFDVQTYAGYEAKPSVTRRAPVS